MREDIKIVCRKCHTCQTTKKTNIKYGHLPVKNNTGQPWDTLCVDLIGPYKIPRKGLDKNGKQQNNLVL